MKIKDIKITGLWNCYDINWVINKPVAILSGINGSGKSTMLKAISSLLKGEFLPNEILNRLSVLEINLDNDIKLKLDVIHDTLRRLKDKSQKDEKLKPLVKKIEEENKDKPNNNLDFRVDAQSITAFKNGRLIKNETIFKEIASDFISTFDYAPAKPEDPSKLMDYIVKAQYSELDRHLDVVISNYKSYLIELSNDVTNMMKSSDITLEKVRSIFDNRNKLFDVFDEFFAGTGKKINRDKGDLEFIFNKDNKSHSYSDLSAGEKQIVLILLIVFMQNKKEAILIMDEPDISLHVDWQEVLLEKILEINPNCQIIVSTHSPSMILRGWQDCVFPVSSLSKGTK